MSLEQWLPVVGWQGRYEISDQGRVRTVGRMISGGFHPSKILAKTKGGRAKNYLRVMLKDNSRRQHAYIHHLVCAAFLGPRPEGLMICHTNDNGQDNHLGNLYYGTREDNEMDRYVKRVSKDLEEAPF